MGLRLAVLLFVCSALARAQMTATLRGSVIDIQGSAVSGAAVRVSNALTGFDASVLTGEDGSFQITNIPFQTYTAVVSKPGFQRWQQAVTLRTNVPQLLEAQLLLETQATRLTGLVIALELEHFHARAA